VGDYDRALAIREELDRKGRLPNLNDLATVLMNRGIAYSGLTEYQKAVGDYDRALAIREELDRKGRLPDRNDLAAVLMSRGVAYISLDDSAYALADMENALAIIEALLPIRPYLIGQYCTTIYIILCGVLLQCEEYIVREKLSQLQIVCEKYPLTDEARQWLQHIEELCAGLGGIPE
jgi:tetratricopeptide (TPR) repeat protein